MQRGKKETTDGVSAAAANMDKLTIGTKRKYHESKTAKGQDAMKKGGNQGSAMKRKRVDKTQLKMAQKELVSASYQLLTISNFLGQTRGVSNPVSRSDS